MAEHQDNRAAPRYNVDTPVQGSIGAQPFSGHLKDISATGAAVVTNVDIGFDNDQFVMLHMQGMGEKTGVVRRRIPEGFALQFDADEDEEKRKRELAEMIRALGPGGLSG